MPEGLKLGVTLTDNVSGPLAGIEKNLRKMAQGWRARCQTIASLI
jgi:hypothetical protein